MGKRRKSLKKNKQIAKVTEALQELSEALNSPRRVHHVTEMSPTPIKRNKSKSTMKGGYSNISPNRSLMKDASFMSTQSRNTKTKNSTSVDLSKKRSSINQYSDY